ncbi:entericidin A/B family lipoprotein [Serpentinimonas barnesii]|nr:entericidin A/B family lipoprotein [Serpentinimonas barnesii]
MKPVLTLLLLAASLTLSGCSTIAGIGKDVQRGGQIIQDAAR